MPYQLHFPFQSSHLLAATQSYPAPLTTANDTVVPGAADYGTTVLFRQWLRLKMCVDFRMLWQSGLQSLRLAVAYL